MKCKQNVKEFCLWSNADKYAISSIQNKTKQNKIKIIAFT